MERRVRETAARREGRGGTLVELRGHAQKWYYSMDSDGDLDDSDEVSKGTGGRMLHDHDDAPKAEPW